MPSCSQRPLHAVPHNAFVDGKYYCEDCRYPPCKGLDQEGCGKRRDNPGGKHRFKDYVCPECRARQEPTADPKPAASSDTRADDTAKPAQAAPQCSYNETSTQEKARENYPMCLKCSKRRSREEGPWTQPASTLYYCSDICRYPRCSGPGANGKGCKAERPKRDRVGKPLRFDEDRKWRCKACAKAPKCIECKLTKAPEEFGQSHLNTVRWGTVKDGPKCIECRRGKGYCLRCGAVFARDHFLPKTWNNAQQRQEDSQKMLESECHRN